MIDKEQYYPTPEALAERLVKLIRIGEPPVLEPSAGTGALANAFAKQHQYSRIHCVEINPERAATLKGLDYPVIWDDWMTFDSLIPYRTIIMNPPFAEGAKHLLKALRLCAPDGEIACLLNAETIKNPCTNSWTPIKQRSGVPSDSTTKSGAITSSVCKASPTTVQMTYSISRSIPWAAVVVTVLI